MNKFFEWINSLLGSIPQDKLLHFIAGTLIGALCAITFGTHPVVTVVIPLTAGFIKECIDYGRYGGFDFVDFGVTTLGGLAIALIQLI